MVPMSGINDKMVSNFNTEAAEQWLQYEEAPLLQYLKTLQELHDLFFSNSSMVLFYLF